jgi:chorismate mutase
VSDDVLDELRAEITAVDREILAAVNRRLQLVDRLKRHKEEHGIAFVDPDREARMLAERLRENAGPLSEDGLRVFYGELLALCKRELA